jgi:UDP-N-acetylglucosamine--N-acetylmuramyl-(pentapeptide) pyrophosphoryl-undecaprenol N-acetylglucosamine transferase
MQQTKVKILISGGGTGGHIFPAIAIAQALKKKVPGCDILFVGAKGKMEMEKVPQAGFPVEGLWISGLQRSLSWKNLLFPFKLIFSMAKAGKIIRRFKPDAVVGVGGYASGPTLKMAARRKIPVVLQEQNSFPGITNKWLAKDADRICVAYDGLERWFPAEKIIKTGNPVRSEVVNIEGKKTEAYEYFELEENRPVVLIVGGSQGARSINESISEHLSGLVKAGLQLIWQTGKLYTVRAQQEISHQVSADIRKRFKVHEFITRMDLAYAAADLVVSRAGAIAISELSAVGKPCLLIPLPTAAEDHQTKNARALADNDAAVFLADNDARENLGDAITGLMANEEKRKSLAKNIKTFAVINSADRIADEILKLINSKNGH